MPEITEQRLAEIEDMVVVGKWTMLRSEVRDLCATLRHFAELAASRLANETRMRIEVEKVKAERDALREKHEQRKSAQEYIDHRTRAAKRKAVRDG